MRARTVVLVAVALLLPACSLFAGSLPDAAEGAWVLTDGTVDGGALQLLPDHRVTLNIAGEEVGGTAACNQYFGRIDTSGGRLTIGDLGQTEMACEPDIMVLESAYLGALQRVDELAVDEDRLHLTGPNVDLRFERVEPLPTSDLVGTVWTLESLIQGDAASSVAGDPATLELTDDGQLSGSTGCRTFMGSYEVAGDTVTLTQLITDDHACPADLEQQDDHVLAVLGDGFTVQIEENRLAVTSAGDRSQGLDYRAG